MRISDWSSDVCSSDLSVGVVVGVARRGGELAELGAREQVDLVAVGARGAVAAIVVVDRLNRHGLERTDRPPAPARARLKISHAVGQGGEDFVGPALELVPGGERSLAARSEEHTSELQYLMR